MIQLIYLAGSGRSGSTLVERTLGQSADTFCLGELHCLWRLRPEEITCSCGARFGDCPVWRGAADARTLARLRELEFKFARHAHIALSGGRLGRIHSLGLREFLDLQWDVLQRLSETTGARRFIDSSKAAPRAWVVASDPRIDLWVVHLRRHAREIIASWLSRKFDPGLGGSMAAKGVSTVAMEILKTRLSLSLLRRERPIGKLDYDAFVASPVEALRALIDAGSLPPDLRVDLEGGDTLRPAELHTLNGNPDRFERGRIRISARSAMEKLSDRQRRLANFAGGLIEAVPV